MANLYEFPYVSSETKPEEGTPSSDFIRLVTETFSTPFVPLRQLLSVQHSFTRYRAILYPYIFQIKHPIEVDGFEWIAVSDLEKLPFSSGHKRIFNQLKS